jgi:hypothetical protein
MRNPAISFVRRSDFEGVPRRQILLEVESGPDAVYPVPACRYDNQVSSR